MVADPDAGDRRAQCRAGAQRSEPRHIGVLARAGLNDDQIPIRPRASSDERPYGERTRLKLPSLPLTIAEQSPARCEAATSRLLPSDSSGHGAERRSVPDHVDAGGYSSTPEASR